MKKITILGLFLALALTTYRCDKADDLTPNTGGDDTTAVVPDKDSTTTEPSDTTTTPSDTTTTPSDTTTVPSDTTILPSDTTTVPSDTTAIDSTTLPQDTVVVEPDTRPLPVVSEDEADYYTAPTSYKKIVNIVDDYGVDNNFETNDTKLVKQAVKDVVAAGGGKIIIPAGNYTFSGIELQSNVHFEIDGGAVIRPAQQSDTKKAYTVFANKIGTVKPYENISVVGVNGMFTIDLTYVNNKNVRCLHFTHIKNFMFANINVIDSETTFATLEFTGKNIDGEVYGPNHGVAKNIHVENTVYGYGLMQMQYGTDILFKDLYCEGGITLRFESHITSYFGTKCINYINRIVCRNITCENGHTPVLLSPHFIKNGWVDARDITSIGCESAVSIGDGYATAAEAAAGHEAGYFSEESTFRDIKATFTETDAQVNPSNFKTMVPERQYLLPSTQPWIFKDGPSLQVILYQSAYYVNIDERDITYATDFLKSQYMYCSTLPFDQKVHRPTIVD